MPDTKVGFIYCAINGSFPDWIKVGCTTKDPHERIKELSVASGVPTPFVLAYSRKVRDPFGVEAYLHNVLDEYRVNDSREFFALPLADAIILIQTFEEAMHQSHWDLDTPFADLFATFPDDTGARELTNDEAAQCRALETKSAPPLSSRTTTKSSIGRYCGRSPVM